jgi:hypothetical protein
LFIYKASVRIKGCWEMLSVKQPAGQRVTRRLMQNPKMTVFASEAKQPPTEILRVAQDDPLGQFASSSDFSQ